MTLWILLMAIYAAPADAVDHKGTWAYDSLKQRGAFVSEADCISAGEEFRQELGQMMRIPFVTHCIPVPKHLSYQQGQQHMYQEKAEEPKAQPEKREVDPRYPDISIGKQRLKPDYIRR